MQSNCQICNKVFNHFAKNRKFCSRECSDKNRPKRTLESKAKISNITKNYFKNATEEEKKKRWEKISKSKLKILPKEGESLIDRLNDFGYIRDITIFSEKSGYGTKAIKRYLKTKGIKAPKFIPYNIQRFSESEFENFRFDLMTLEWDKISKKYNISKKIIKSVAKKLKIQVKRKNPSRKETSPEKFVRNFLETLNINFRKEVYIANNRWRVDFLIENDKIIEVNGDFWHANPKIYSVDKLTTIQKNNVLRDIEKFNWINQNNYKLLIIWEQDIKFNTEDIKNKIEKYVKQL